MPPPARTNAVGPGRGSGGIGRFWHRPPGADKDAQRGGAQPPAAARHHLDQGAGAGGRGGPLRARDDAAVDGDRHALGVVLGGEAGHEVGDGGAGADLDRLAVDVERERRHAGASASMSGATGRRATRSTTAAAVSGASRMPLR